MNPDTLAAPDWRERAAVFARAAVDAAQRAIPVEVPITVDYARRDVQVRRRDPTDQREGAIARLGWRDPRGAAPRIRAVPVNAARIGPLGIATNAGELFVEWGLSVKKRSPFPHTIVSELTNEWIGYEPTARAFQHEGYEALAGVNFVSLEGIQTLVDTAVELFARFVGKRCPLAVRFVRLTNQDNRALVQWNLSPKTPEGDLLFRLTEPR